MPSLYALNGQANHLPDTPRDVFRRLLPIAVEILSGLWYLFAGREGQDSRVFEGQRRTDDGLVELCVRRNVQ